LQCLCDDLAEHGAKAPKDRLPEGSGIQSSGQRRLRMILFHCWIEKRSQRLKQRDPLGGVVFHFQNGGGTLQARHGLGTVEGGGGGGQLLGFCQTPFHEKVVKLNIEIYFANFMLGAGLGLVGHWPWSH
jgi:hypothetical protein